MAGIVAVCGCSLVQVRSTRQYHAHLTKFVIFFQLGFVFILSISASAGFLGRIGKGLYMMTGLMKLISCQLLFWLQYTGRL